MATDARRLVAIRRLLRRVPHGGAKECLERIEAIVSGKGDTEAYFRAPTNANLHDRLEAGAASRPGDPVQERTEKGGRDRKKRGGLTRSEGGNREGA